MIDYSYIITLTNWSLISMTAMTTMADSDSHYVYVLNYHDQNNDRTVGVFNSMNELTNSMNTLQQDTIKYYGNFDSKRLHTKIKSDTYYCSIVYSTAMGINISMIREVHSTRETLPEKSGLTKFTYLRHAIFITNKIYGLDTYINSNLI